MDKSNNIIFVGVLAILASLFVYNSKSTKERYANQWYNGDLDNTMLQRPTFNANLNPNNPNMRFDSNVYGGFIKGASPPSGFLASTNLQSGESLGPRETIRDFKSGVNNAYTSIGQSKERFAPVLSGSYNGPVGTQNSGNSVQQGTYTAGMNDAASYINFADVATQSAANVSEYASVGGGYQNGAISQNQKMNLGKMSISMNEGTNPASTSYQSMGTDFAYLATPGSVALQKAQADKKYKVSLDNSIPNTLEYTLPSEMLPTPDMRQPLVRDPSDPTNFMYDRTLFAPLKSRNRNTPDRVRGDLDIQPIKTGYFDISTVQSVDLAKGYFGYFNDIQETTDLQDVAYSRSSDTGAETTTSSARLNNLLTALNKNMMKPKPAYGVVPPLKFGPIDQNNNPYWNDAEGTVNSVWARP